jgi:hypothetical protein
MTPAVDTTPTSEHKAPEGTEVPGGLEKPPPPNPDNIVEKISGAMIPVTIVAIWLYSLISGAWSTEKPKLDVVTSAVRDTFVSQWNISGRVVHTDDGRPMRVRVWAVAVDPAGNRFSPPEDITDSAGRFQLEPIPAFLTRDTAQANLATEVTVHASTIAADDSTRLLGQENLRLSAAGRVRWTSPDPFALIFIGILFLSTVIIGLVQSGKSDWARRTKYFALVVLSLLFTLTMIVVIAVGLKNVNEDSRAGDVISLGFANIYQGSYVKDVPPEWLLSFTAPEPSALGAVSHGFGVPLWLLLVAVLGSGVYTIALLVKHVNEEPGDEKEYRARVGNLVSHQFYMLFSPLGAVLIYQLMVAAGSASVQVTVAFVIFAAGVAANALLDQAVKKVQEVLR